MLPKVSKTKEKVILASSSKIRKQLLEEVGLDFSVINSKVNEDFLKKELQGRPFSEQVTRLASEKASVVSKNNKESFVIGSDNMCTIDNKIFDKPIDHSEAINHLLSLSGKSHFQNNGISIYHKGNEIWSNFDATELIMKELSIKGASLHSTRRTCLTTLKDKGWQTSDIMAVSGHKDLNSLEKYLHTTPKQMKKMVNDFD